MILGYLVYNFDSGRMASFSAEVIPYEDMDA